MDKVNLSKFPFALLAQARDLSDKELEEKNASPAQIRVFRAHRNYTVKRVTLDQLRSLLIQSGLLSKFGSLDEQSLALGLRHLCRGLSWHQPAQLTRSNVFFALLEEVDHHDDPEESEARIALERHGIVPLPHGEVHSSLEKYPYRSTIFKSLISFPESSSPTRFPWNKQVIRGLCAMTVQKQHRAKHYTLNDTHFPVMITILCVAQHSAPLAGARLMHAVMSWTKGQGFPGINLVASEFSFTKCFYNNLGFRCINRMPSHSGATFSAHQLGCKSPENANLCPKGSMYADLGHWDGTLPVKWTNPEINSAVGRCPDNPNACLSCPVIGTPDETRTCDNRSAAEIKGYPNYETEHKSKEGKKHELPIKAIPSVSLIDVNIDRYGFPWNPTEEETRKYQKWFDEAIRKYLSTMRTLKESGKGAHDASFAHIQPRLPAQLVDIIRDTLHNRSRNVVSNLPDKVLREFAEYNAFEEALRMLHQSS